MLPKDEVVRIKEYLTETYGSITFAAQVIGLPAPTLFTWLGRGAIPAEKEHLLNFLLTNTLDTLDAQIKSTQN